MIINVLMLYALIVAVALIDYAVIRFKLSSGLSLSFAHYRSSGNLEETFSRYSKDYFSSMFWMSLAVCIAVFSLFRLFNLLGILNIEMGILLSALVLFYVKDQILYTTALFVIKRANQE